MIRKRQSRQEQGSTIIEFVLTVSLVMVPLLLGTMVIGFNLIRAMQANQVNRDAGHMFARGVDFSTGTGAGNRAVLTSMAPRLANSTTTGTGVVILSSVQFVGPTTCTNCANLNHAVFTRQLVIGNAALRTSVLGKVPSASMLQDGSGTVTDPYKDTAVRADNILNLLPSINGNPPLADGQVAYVSETYFTSPDFDLQGFLKPSGTYVRAIF